MKIQINKLTRLILAKGDPLPPPVDTNVDSMEFDNSSQMAKLDLPGDKTLSQDGQTITVSTPATPASIPVSGGITQAERDKLAGLVNKRIELVAGTWVGNQARITFNPAFSTPPLVDSSPTWVASQMIIGQASNITTTGCDVTVMRSKGTLLLTAGPFEAAPTGTAFRMLVFST